MFSTKFEDGDVITIKKDAKAIGKMVKDDIKADVSPYKHLILASLLITGIEIASAVAMNLVAKFELVYVFPVVVLLTNFVLLGRLQGIRDELDKEKKENGIGEM